MSDDHEIVPAICEMTSPVVSPQPPLGISHLLLWTFGAAVVLAVYRSLAGSSDLTPRMQFFQAAFQLVFSMLAGINVAAVVVYLRRLVVRDAPLLTEPGHWLLVIAGASNLVAWLIFGVAVAIRAVQGAAQPWELPFFMYWLPYSVGSFVAAAANWVALVRLREPLRWRLCFLVSGVFALALGFTFGAMFLYSIQEPPDESFSAAVQAYACLYPLDQLAGTVLLAFNLLADRANDQRRDWIHRVGVIATLFQSIVSLAFYILLMWGSAAGL
ncbi:MAG: hypothetical protein WEH44_10070 [Pirellulaceae bacterium]